MINSIDKDYPQDEGVEPLREVVYMSPEEALEFLPKSDVLYYIGPFEEFPGIYVEVYLEELSELRFHICKTVNDNYLYLEKLKDAKFIIPYNCDFFEINFDDANAIIEYEGEKNLCFPVEKIKEKMGRLL